MTPEAVDHPHHYNEHPAGIECIDVVEAFTFNVGNAVKYLWRAGRKGDRVTDLRKAAWYIAREIERMDSLGADVDAARPGGAYPGEQHVTMDAASGKLS